MTYIRLDDDHPTNPKVADLSDAAYRRWVYCISACSRHQTDGYMTDGLFREVVPLKKTRDELIAKNFVEAFPGGWVIHHYLDKQRSRAEIDELARKRAEAGKRGGESKARRNQRA